MFHSSIGPITPALAARLTGTSWRPGCPVPLADLRYLTVLHHRFDGTVDTGELVVNAQVADSLVTVFRTLFDDGYPIRSMRLVDDYGASDDASMAADNTSAFNCRAVTGGTGWSEHSYGLAVDVNPRNYRRSRRQLRKFTRIRGAENWRPLQELHGRSPCRNTWQETDRT